MEGAYAIATNNLVSLSERQLADCSCAASGGCGSHGCEGGFDNDAYTYVINHGGIASEDTYPYAPSDAACNTAQASKTVFTLTGYTDVPAHEADLLTVSGTICGLVWSVFVILSI